MKSTLLLNVSYEPLSVVSARRAVRLVDTGKALIEDESPYYFTTASNDRIVIPYVARLVQDKKHRGALKAPNFSRRGVLVRDNFTCAYCGKHADTIDHVLPRALGGGTSFENCVAACLKCNGKKGHKTLKQMGWSLKQAPVPVSSYSRIFHLAQKDEELFDSWIEYLSWYDEAAKAEKLRRQALVS